MVAVLCVCSNDFYQQELGVGKLDMLSGTTQLPAHFQPVFFPKLLSMEEDTKGLQLPFPKL